MSVYRLRRPALFCHRWAVALDWRQPAIFRASSSSRSTLFLNRFSAKYSSFKIVVDTDACRIDKLLLTKWRSSVKGLIQ